MTARTLLTGLAAAALTALAAAPVSAQSGKLTGRVVDAQSGEPLPGAQVFLEGTGIGTLSAENGRYFLLNVQPGTYTLVAQLIGYATVRRENVLVAIDVTRTVDFEMPSQAVAVEEIVVEAERTPLIETQATGSSDIISIQEINNLPVSSINEALALRSGFLDVPQNTDVVSQIEEERGLDPVRIRGGRGGETLTLLDGVPINNFVFGGAAFQPNPFVLRQLDFIRGGFEPQYGNALSGIVNIALREGGTELEGALDYQTSALAGALGSTPDELAREHLFQGFLSGPVPGTDDRVRFMLSGREERGAARVLEFDDEVFDPRFNTPQLGAIQPNQFDLTPGWRSFGFDDQRDLLAKLTLYASPTAKLSLFGLDYTRQTEPFNFSLILAEADPVAACTDTHGDPPACEAQYGNSGIGDISFGSIRQDRRLYAARWDHTLDRAFYNLTLSRFDQSRETCNFYQGVCLEGRFANTNFTENFQAPGQTPIFPASGTQRRYGGESLETWMGRADAEYQISDHHNLKTGVFYQRHDIDFTEIQDIGTSDITLDTLTYAAEPWEAAFYVQDRIEYDFVTVRLGFRFDFGEAGGLFLQNPLDPTNSTTAFDVCDNPGEWQNVRVRRFDASTGQIVEETLSADPSWTRQACADDRDLLTQAALIASGDDFATSKRRSQFSPRLGISVPVTETSSAFFNYGRFSQNPLYNNVFQATGIGTAMEGTPGGVGIESPAANVPFVGNSNLVIEQTSSYELGYLAEIADRFALQAILFSKDQTGLTGVRTGGILPGGGQVFDPGVTYGSNAPSYLIVVNQDYTTVRGLEVGFRKRLEDHWAFSLNYAFSRATTNASPPDRQTERLSVENDPGSLREITSDIDQPHAFNGTLTFRVDDESPVDGVVGNALRNTLLSFVVRAASGLPYTPVEVGTGLGFAPTRREINSDRGPATIQVDLQAQKSWRVGAVNYGLYMQVRNVLDRVNCIQVSPETGDCTSGGIDFLRRREGNLPNSSTSFDRADRVGQRRSILAGVRLSF